MTPNDTFYGNWDWPAQMVDLPAAWDVSTGAASVVIAVLDTGVTPVADLQGALVPGTSFVGGDTTDGNGHGTAVASVAAARLNNHLGIAGVCGGCSIMPVKIADATGTTSSSTVVEGVDWAVAHGAKVINLSFGGSKDDPALDAAFQRAEAAGVVVVLAAGNAGSSDPAAGGYPAAAVPEAIRVGAVDPNRNLYSWSNRGNWVDVGAPGSVAALMTNGNAMLGMQGTSLAAPIIAGAAGLLLSRFPSLTPAAVKSILLQSATPATLPVADVYQALLRAGTPAVVHAPAIAKAPVARQVKKSVK
jgi:subtilisin family serine protease